MRKMRSIVTKEGDGGLTSFPMCSEKIRKSDIRIEVLGALDELQAWITSTYEVDKSHIDSEYLNVLVSDCQSIMTCIVAGRDIQQDLVEAIETHIDTLEKNLSPFTGFIHPGGSLVKAVANITRTVARRAERVFDRYLLSERNECSNIRRFMNRLSDYMYLYSVI